MTSILKQYRTSPLWKKWESTRSAFVANILSKFFGYEPDLKEMHGRYSEYPKTDGPQDYSEFYDGTHELLTNEPF